MNKAVFLDRDGLINFPLANEKRHDINNYKFFERTFDALKELASFEYKIIIVTNQKGISDGIFSEEVFHKVMGHYVEMIESNGGRIDKYYYCPHAEDAGCACRKPKTLMIDKAKKEFDIDLTKSWMIGDRTSDVQTGITAGTKTILVKTGHAGEDGRCQVTPDYVADNLYEAVKIITGD
jgi:D,D-heptose 1,7-bisphosphate phosphatase